MASWTDVLGAIEAGVVTDPVVPFDGPKVLAVDMSGDFAAAFSYTWADDEATTEITFAHRSAGSWIELRTNGPSTSGGPFRNWRRSDAALYTGYQERLGLSHMHLPVLTVSAGICGTAAVTVRASSDDGNARITLKELPIRSNLGAFVVLIEGDVPVDISLLDVDGNVVGDPWPRRKRKEGYD